MQNLFKHRIAKFCKRTMCLMLAAFVVIPAISYSIPNGFKSAKALSSYETVGVGKKLVDCFPGEDRIFSQYVYETVLGKSNWSSAGETYTLEDSDVQTIQNYKGIDISDQCLGDINGVQNFTSLTNLDASLNQLTYLPENLPDTITCLNVSSNQLSCLPENLPSKLTYLHATGNKLSSLPENLPDTITTLYVSWNNLTSLPKLPASLTKLFVSRNQLSSIAELPAGLTKLEVSNNHFTYLPELPNKLTELDVSSNQLSSLPELPAGLTHLAADKNKLTFLPKLPDNLTYLDISSNYLTSLPENLPSGLIELYAQNNQLKELDLFNMANLSDINVSGQAPQFEYIVTSDGNYKILDVPTQNLSDIIINGEKYNYYDNSGSIIVSSKPTSFTYNYNTGHNNAKINITVAFAQLNLISLNPSPTNTSYTKGEKFDPSDLVITYTFNNQPNEDIIYNESTKADFTFTPGLETALTPDIDKVTKTYAEKSASQETPVIGYIYTTITDQDIKVISRGFFSENTTLTINDINPSDDNYFSLLGSLEANKKTILSADVSIENGSYKPGSSMTLTFEVDPIYNGKTATIKHLLSNGQIETYTATVIDGKIQITVTELSPFIIAIDEDPVSTDDSNGSYYATGDNAPITALFAIITSSVMIISGYIIINRKKFLQK